MAKVEQRVVGLLWSFRREKYFLIDIYNIKSYARQLKRKWIKRRNKFTEINFWRHLAKIFLSIVSIEEGGSCEGGIDIKIYFSSSLSSLCHDKKKQYEKKN